jgi:hypothetical protein
MTTFFQPDGPEARFLEITERARQELDDDTLDISEDEMRIHELEACLTDIIFSANEMMTADWCENQCRTFAAIIKYKARRGLE